MPVTDFDVIVGTTLEQLYSFKTKLSVNLGNLIIELPVTLGPAAHDITVS